MIKTLLKGQYGSNRVDPYSNYLKILETGKNWRVCQKLFRLLKGEYGTNHSVLDFSFMSI